MGLNHFLISKGLTLGNQASAPSNPVNGDAYYDSTLQVFRFYENGQWIALGSGSGSGSGINYLAQAGTISYNFEFNNINGWSKYLNTSGSGSTPDVSPTGTPSPNFTFASSSSSPLRGTYSGLITKDAANRQGNGIRTVAFNIDSQDVGKTLYVSMDFSTSANYVTGDLQVFISDGTNIINVGNPTLSASSGSNATLITSFVASTSTSYQLILHVAGTNALAWTAKVDSFSVGPQTAAIVPAMSDWAEFVPSLTGDTSGTFVLGTGGSASFRAFYRRVGDSMDLIFDLSAGTSGNTWPVGSFRFHLPPGYSIDYTKLPRTNTKGNINALGSGQVANSAATQYGVTVYTGGPVDVNSFVLTLDEATSPGGLVTNVNPFTFTNGSAIGFYLKGVPIANWTTGIQVVNTSSEYAFNTGSVTSAGGSDTTSFGNGPQGTPINAFTTTATNSSTNMRVQFQTPIQASDILQVEILRPGSSVWESVLADGLNEQFNGSVTAGIGLLNVSGNPYQLDVRFYNGGVNFGGSSAFNSVGSSWSGQSGSSWRVRKTAGAALVGIVPDQIGQQMSALGGEGIAANFSDTTMVGNVGLLLNWAAVTSSASPLQITLTDKSGNSLSSSNPALINFAYPLSAYNSTLQNIPAFAGVLSRPVTAPLSISIPGSTANILGLSGYEGFERVYIWAYDNSGTVGLAVSGSGYQPSMGNSDAAQIASSITAISTSATSSTTLYGNTSITGPIAIKLIGYMDFSWGGTWFNGTELGFAALNLIGTKNVDPFKLPPQGVASGIFRVPLGGFVQSASSGNQTTTSTSMVAITNLNVSLQTKGNPVEIGFQGDGFNFPSGANQPSYFFISNSSSTAQAYISIQRNGIEVFRYLMETVAVGASAVQMSTIPSAIRFTDLRCPAGLVNYGAQWIVSGSTSLQVVNCVIWAKEMGVN